MTAFRPVRTVRNRYNEPLNPVAWLIHFFETNQSRAAPHSSPRIHSLRHRWRIRRTVTVVKALIALWVVVLYWGERLEFRNKVASCDWELWEDWPADARPHRMLLVADPQLVDPHTYPGRPWPLSSLTIAYTDHYMSRVFRLSTLGLQPKTVMFLGDIFDGGREWATSGSHSPDKQYWKYGYRYWMGEYQRFEDIFLKVWDEHQEKLGPEAAGELKFLAGLPGNHDLGFAAGIQEPVRKRFHTYFGESNRVNIIANHTFVSLDTVSLSAMTTDAGPELWKPTSDFLDDNLALRGRAVEKALRRAHGDFSDAKYEHRVFEADELVRAKLPEPAADAKELPMVLLTHVPLYRDSGTPCGPLRERWPPSSLGNSRQPLLRDNRNAITVAAGYQYQNVLSQTVTSKIIKTLGEIKYAFSGDDHDYCELLHSDDSSAPGVREITVKSISMAMGVRKPGFLQVSLYNPVDIDGNSISPESEGEAPTLQTNLCLMPDQLGILLKYLILIVFTICTLAVRAFYIAQSHHGDPASNGHALLPTVREDPKGEEDGRSSEAGNGSATPSTNPVRRHRARSSLVLRTRANSMSPTRAAYMVNGSPSLTPVESKSAVVETFGLANPGHSDLFGAHDMHTTPMKRARRRRPLTGWRLALERFARSLAQVAGVAGLWYWWLMRNG